MADTLRECELEVERARQKLNGDLEVLRAPETFASFTAGLKQDAMETKDSLVAEAKQAVESRVSGLVEEMKAKAAANPAAALMIGAGIGWYLLRRPPITTALIGCGLFSLLRTPATARPGAQTQDYVREGQQRLKRQAQQFAADSSEAARAMAAKAGEKIATTTGELLDTARESATRLSHDARDQVAGAASTVRGQVESLMANASGVIANASGVIANAGSVTADLGEDLTRTAGAAFQSASDGIGRAAASAREVLPEVEARDRLLLGVAGLAVAAALGVACQKRFADESQ